MPESVVQAFLTLGQIVERTGEPPHRVKYAIDAYHIKPVMRIGITRVWSEDQLGAIRSALARVAGRREGI